MTTSLKVVGALVCAVASCVLAQDGSHPSPDVAQLSQQLQQTRTDLADSKRQIEELRQSLEELRRQVQSGHPVESAPAVTAEPTVSAADQDVGFLAAKI